MTGNPSDNQQPSSKKCEQSSSKKYGLRGRILFIRILSLVNVAAGGANIIAALINHIHGIGYTFQVSVLCLNIAVFFQMRHIANRLCFLHAVVEEDHSPHGKIMGLDKQPGDRNPLQISLDMKDLTMWEYAIVVRLATLGKAKLPIWSLVFRDPTRLIEWIISWICFKLWTFNRSRFFKFAGERIVEDK